MDAVAALNEIAFWLERGRAATFKVQAFRKAAGVIAPLAPEEVAARVRNGRLKSMKGIGDRTYQVIREAVEGRVPDYLADLREKGAQPLASGGSAIREALRGDLHSHSEWSDGGSPIELMLAAAGVLGRDYLALTDHSPNLTIANGLSSGQVRVRLHAYSQNDTRLRVQGGDHTLTLDAGHKDQVTLNMKASANGVAYVNLQLLAPDGRPFGDTRVLQVRATGYGRTALLITGISLAVLFLGVGIRVVRRRAERAEESVD